MSNISASSADRCLAILELLVNEPGGLPMSIIAQRLALPVSATHRLLAVLVGRRYVRQGPGSEAYHATMTVAALGVRLLAGSNLTEVSQPILEDLAGTTGELVRLAVLEGQHLVWVAKAQGARTSIRYDPISGRDVPLHTTAMGKAWLATLPEDEAVRLVEERGFEVDLVGPNAVRTVKGLREQLRLTRDRGFAVVEEEAEAGISAISAVVRDATDPKKPVVGCLAVAGPTFRLERERLVGFAAPLKQACEHLSDLWPIRQYQSRTAAAGRVA